MEAKHAKELMEMYASVYEGYGKKKKVMHDCSTHCEHDEWGKGVMIEEMHTLDDGGNVTHYDIQFEHGIEKNVPVEELVIEKKKMHEHFINDEKNAEVLGERSTDLFDYLLEYLVAEGYADTNKAALAIMANMSEEWKQEIVDACELQEKLKPGTKRVSFSTGRDDSHNQTMTERNPRTGRQRGTSPELKAIGAHARARTAQRNAEKSGDTQAAQRHKNRRDKIATVVYNKTNRIIDRADND